MDGSETGDSDKAAASIPLDHVPSCALESKKCTVEVESSGPPEVFNRHVDKSRAKLAIARIGEARADPPQLHRAREGAGHGLWIGDIGDDAEATNAMLDERLYHAVIALSIIGPRLRQSARNRLPDAGAFTGDDRDLPGQVEEPGHANYGAPCK